MGRYMAAYEALRLINSYLVERTIAQTPHQRQVTQHRRRV